MGWATKEKKMRKGGGGVRADKPLTITEDFERRRLQLSLHEPRVRKLEGQ
jgi:hypothetical protein